MALQQQQQRRHLHYCKKLFFFIVTRTMNPDLYPADNSYKS